MYNNTFLYFQRLISIHQKNNRESLHNTNLCNVYFLGKFVTMEILHIKRGGIESEKATKSLANARHFPLSPSAFLKGGYYE